MLPLYLMILLFAVVQAAGATAAGETLAPPPPGAAQPQKELPSKGLKLKPLPLVNYNSDTGLGYGLALSLINFDGIRRDYQWKFYIEYMATTGGQMDPDIRFDFPLLKIGEQPLRLQGFAEYKFVLFENYYGYGNDDIEIGYRRELEEAHYFDYQKTNPYGYITISMPLLWGKTRGHDKTLDLILGTYADYYFFRRSSKDGREFASKLFVERPVGIDGGMALSFLAGARFDNRDFEPNPHRGTYNEIMFEISSTAIGSRYNFARMTVKHSAYAEPFPHYRRLVIAERIMIDHLFGGAPFFKAEKFGGVDTIEGIGGNESMRGITKFRYKNDLKIVWTPEVRWRVGSLGPFLGDLWHFELILFSDIGSAWSGFNTFNISELLFTAGPALRVCWGEAFIVALDIGFSANDMGVYIGLDHQF